MIHDWIWKLRSVCYCYLNINFQYLNNITHFFTSYVFLRNNVNSTRNILLGLKWLKMAFHLESSFSLVLMWMQHTRQIINRKVNKSPSQMQLISQFCVFFLSSMKYELAGEFFNQKKKKKFVGEEQKSILKFYQSTNRFMSLLLAFSSYSLSLIVW